MSCVRAAPTAAPAMRLVTRSTVMAVGNTLAWIRARWRMRASIGTPQTAASAVVAAGEPCWAVPSCHAVA